LIRPNTIIKEYPVIHSRIRKMVQENIVIAIIIIVLFVVITLLSYGIYRLVQAGRASSNGSSSSSGLVDD